MKRNWEPQNTLPSRIDSVQPLFERIDVKQIEHEIEKLYGAVNEIEKKTFQVNERSFVMQYGSLFLSFKRKVQQGLQE